MNILFPLKMWRASRIKRHVQVTAKKKITLKQPVYSLYSKCIIMFPNNMAYAIKRKFKGTIHAMSKVPVSPKCRMNM